MGMVMVEMEMAMVMEMAMAMSYLLFLSLLEIMSPGLNTSTIKIFIENTLLAKWLA